MPVQQAVPCIRRSVTTRAATQKIVLLRLYKEGGTENVAAVFAQQLLTFSWIRLSSPLKPVEGAKHVNFVAQNNLSLSKVL